LNRSRRAGLDREGLLRVLTFWLRPAFALRVLHRFQLIAGFDRAVALASSALTALIPLAVVLGAVLTRVGSEAIADRIINRYELTGGGADAVRDVFSPPGGTSTSVGVIGALLMLVAVLSFTRAVQRLFEQTWELAALSFRNTLNGLRWAVAVIAYVLASGWIHAVVGSGRLDLIASLLVMPLTAAFLVWGGWILSGKRIAWRDLLPFGVIASILTAAYSVGAAVYVPHLFSSYATRYGVIGAVFAMISTLFCVFLVLVGSAALGREVSDELRRIRRGERPPDHEVRREWDKVLGEVRSRWTAARERIDRRAGREEPHP
jgi:uncharacterized BrkB/YihY/UPF0761 family membrane protein